MAVFNTQQNNKNDNEVSVNTRGIQFYNKEGFDPSTLDLKFWNDFICISLYPALPPEKRTQTKVFDYEKEVRATLSPSIVKILTEVTKTKIFPAIANGEDRTIGIQFGGDSMICVGTGKKQTGEIKPCIAIHKGIDPDTRKAEISMYYEFNKSQVIENYNEDTGECGIVTSENGELISFIAMLDAAVEAISKAGVHADRYVKKFFNEKLMNTVIAIGDKVGADPSSVSRGGYKNKGGSQVNWGSTSSDDIAADAESAMVGSIGDISELMS